MNIPNQSTLKLTHFGRRSGKPFDVTIWFADIDGSLWIGSLDESRNWVRNLRATGRGRVDFGSGAVDVAAEFVESEADKQRYRDAVTAKYPVLSRLIALFGIGKKRAVFRLT
ncbi:MAG: nitroreductase family deazaflavin-dependent oxidoreductase [Candidatus Binatia bacterium]